jgi:2-oxoglutarate ferredoxin oxidoreductase subunit alpha
MANRVLMTGNEALGEGAIRAGCDAYFGYPITPQNELTAYMAQHMAARGRVFIQAESEVAAINMVYGAASTGKRAMTSSSSPGISLKQEGISFLAAAELPALVVNVQRGGPGLGNIAPSQADYFQAVKGGGHGDYHVLVLAPDSVQEMHDFPRLAFELADRYRSPVMVLADGRLGQMMEPLELRPELAEPPAPKPWALTGAVGREQNCVRSLFLVDGVLEKHNEKLQAKFARMAKAEIRFEEHRTDDCEWLLIAYGTCARIARGVVERVRARGVKAGILRPISLWPYPTARIRELAGRVQGILVVEMSAGQMLQDVQLAVEGRVPVGFEGRTGGGVPTESEILNAFNRFRNHCRTTRRTLAAAAQERDPTL